MKTKHESPKVGRTKIVKLLQEQVHTLMIEKADGEELKKRLGIAEEELALAKAQSKLKCDEYENTIEQLQKENESLKEKRQYVITQAQKVEKSSNDAERAIKWKAKYKALLAASPDSVQEKTTEYIEEQNKNKEELEKSKEINADLSQQVKQLREQYIVACDENSKLKSRISEAKAESSTLRKQLDDANQRISQLQKQHEKKSSLLSYNRQKQLKEKKAQATSESEAKRELSDCQKKLSSQSSEIEKLRNQLSIESSARKKAERNESKIKSMLDKTVSEYESKIEAANVKQSSLQEQIDYLESTSQTIGADSEHLQAENTKLRQLLTRAEKTKKRKEKLTNVVKDLEVTITELNDSLNTTREEASNREDELKHVLVHHIGSDALSLDWNGCLGAIDKLIEDKNMDIQTSENEHQKEIEELHNKIDSLEIECQQAKDEATVIIQNSQNESRIDRENHEYDSVNSFRNALSKRIVQRLFHTVTHDLRTVISAVTGEEQSTLRGVILSVVFSLRWKKFSHTEEYDPCGILEYAGQPPIFNAQSLIAKFDADREEIAKTRTSMSLMTKASQDLSNQIEMYKKEAQDALDEAANAKKVAQDCTQKLAKMTKKCEARVEASVYEAAKKEISHQKFVLDQKEDEMRDLKNQLLAMQDELEKIQDDWTVLQKRQEDAELAREEIKGLREELQITQAALKERTRDLLALERQYNQMKKQYVVVHDSSLLNSESQNEKSVEAAFMTDQLTAGLKDIQERILKGDPAI